MAQEMTQVFDTPGGCDLVVKNGEGKVEVTGWDKPQTQITALKQSDGVEIEILWVSEEIRGAGYGTQLVREVEKQAIAKGAGIAFLKTGEARKFYEKLGYEVFGVLEDRPIGTRLYHMKKRLRA